MAPIAFMVMPFGRKKTGTTRDDVPPEIEFDLLWDRVYHPVLADAGYQPVRADQDVGALIISEMLQRLALADLVVADISLPNANVYYEVGVRHSAKPSGCVLVAAEWAEPVFDLGQMRQLRFPLGDGAVGDAAATAARTTLADKLAAAGDGLSPVFESIPGFPDHIDASHLATFREFVTELTDFDADVRAARRAPAHAQRALAERVVEQHGHKKVVRRAVVIELVQLVRDLVGMEAVLAYIDTLPQDLKRFPLIVEQRCLAIAKTGDPLGAAARLERLIEDEGPSPERMGLLGGRYKELRRASTTQIDTARYLELEIESYRTGMLLDLNEYYCASNLPRLYRRRRGPGDDVLAAEAHQIAATACRRGIDLGIADEWARSTLLTLAFDAGDVAAARELAAEVIRDAGIGWQLASTIGDLREVVEHQADDAVRDQLRDVKNSLVDFQIGDAGVKGGT